MQVFDLSTTSNTVNIQWFEDSMVVFDRTEFYALQKKYPDTELFWNILIGRIKVKLSRKNFSKK